MAPPEKPAAIAVSRCPVCDAGSGIVTHLVRGHRIAVCAQCQLGWLAQAAHPGADFYGHDYFCGGDDAVGYRDYFALEPALRRSAAIRLQRILRILRPTGRRLLDVGCGPGFFLDVARASGFTVQGVELSPFAAHHAQEHLGLLVAQGDFPGTPLPAAGFDVVTLWDVIEHLADAHAMMAEIARVLAPGGSLVFSTGDRTAPFARLSGRRWHLYNLPEHLYFYSPESLRRLLDAHGLRLQALRHEASHYPLAYLAERVEKTLRVRVPLGRLGRVALPINLGDIVTGYAVRPA